MVWTNLGPRSLMQQPAGRWRELKQPRSSGKARLPMHTDVTAAFERQETGRMLPLWDRSRFLASVACYRTSALYVLRYSQTPGHVSSDALLGKSLMNCASWLSARCLNSTKENVATTDPAHFHIADLLTLEPLHPHQLEPTRKAREGPWQIFVHYF
jgi:hypothetical protein